MRYEKPNAEVIELDMEDIVCLSLGNGSSENDNNNPWT